MARGMSFDAIAPHYRWLEWVTAGSLLQRCRTAFLHELTDARHVLLLGEGRGRFLVELLRVNPSARFTCLDASARMLDHMRREVRRRRLPDSRLTFLKADVLADIAGVIGEQGPFDVVASHFFLDCFQPDQLQRVVAEVGKGVSPGGRWVLSDFRVPEAGWRRLRARLILAGLYRFFRIVTHLPARRLTPPDAALREAGFELKQRRLFNSQLLHADLWERSG